jgi:hypothetical protein
VKRETHGMKGTATYRAWVSMKNRCLNPKADSWEWYGGKGITVCAEWVDSFTRFWEDMGTCPEGFTLERREGDKGYDKANCLWTTRQVQNRNRASNILISYKEKTQCLLDWTNELGLPYNTIRMRLKAGWCIEEAFTRPIQEKRYVPV